MLALKAQLESLVGTQVGHFTFDQNCPTHYLKEMLKQYLDFILAKEQQNLANSIQVSEAPAEAPAETQPEATPAPVVEAQPEATPAE